MNKAASLGFIFMLLLIIAPLVTGIVLLVLSRRGRAAHAACGKCGYDVTPSVGTVDRCPECGERFVESGVVAPSKGKRPVMFGIGLALVIVSGSCIGLSLVSALFTAARRTATVAPAAPPPPPAPAETAEPVEQPDAATDR